MKIKLMAAVFGFAILSASAVSANEVGSTSLMSESANFIELDDTQLAGVSGERGYIGYRAPRYRYSRYYRGATIGFRSSNRGSGLYSRTRNGSYSTRGSRNRISF